MQRRRHVRVSVPAGTMPSSPQGYAGPDTSRMDQGLPAKYWEGDTQQQARVSRMAGAGSQVGPPQFNPDPNIAAVGLGTVRRQWPSAYMPISDTIIYTMSSVADEIPAWGTAPRQRDVMLRNFWPTEPFLASAVMAYASKYTALTWTIEGPDTVADPITEMLHTAEHGKGWNHLMMPTVIDMLTQDNGGWWEIVRLDDDPMSPCVTLNHLDSGRCIRTGQWEEPIVYIDILGIHHRMKWYQVAEFVEMPSPIETARGMQYSALTRCLRAAQIMRDYNIYMHEKVSGRFNKAIHLVSGIQSAVISSALEEHREAANQQGLTRYMQPAVVASLDPNAKVSVATLQLAGLPEGFDIRENLQQYITNLALAFGGDYQDLAPLPSRSGMGASQSSSEVLHLKSRGKGIALFMANTEHTMNYHGIMPRNATFSYDEADNIEAIEETELQLERAKKRQVQIMSGETSPVMARIEAVAVGDIDPDWLTAPGVAESLPTEAPGAFPGAPMHMPDGTTTTPGTQPAKDGNAPVGGSPTRTTRTARGMPAHNNGSAGGRVASD